MAIRVPCFRADCWAMLEDDEDEGAGSTLLTLAGGALISVAQPAMTTLAARAKAQAESLSQAMPVRFRGVVIFPSIAPDNSRGVWVERRAEAAQLESPNYPRLAPIRPAG